jgi:hypothetical protein
MSNKFIIYCIKILDGIKLHVTSLVLQVAKVLTSLLQVNNKKMVLTSSLLHVHNKIMVLSSNLLEIRNIMVVCTVLHQI